MANECKVFELTPPSIHNAPVRKVPFLAKQQLSSGGTVSAAFSKSTRLVSITTSTAGTLEFSRRSGTSWVDPDGNGDTIPISANEWLDFEVPGAIKVRFV